MAKLIRQVVRRPADIIARYGGEEFCCVLPETSLDGACKIAKDILHAIRFTAIPFENSPTCLYVTLSMGVHSILPVEDGSWQELLEQADKYLYEAKRNGRNRICCVKGEVK